MKAKSINGNSPEEIQSALNESMTDGFKQALAIVFISVMQDRNAVCEILHGKGIEIVGATSCGEFINGYQGEGSAVILLLDLNPEAYTILFEDMGGKNIYEASTNLARCRGIFPGFKKM